MTKENLIEKIQKLMAKANGKGSTPEESAAFLAKAKKLMTEHRIESSELETEEIIIDNENPLEKTGRLSTWKGKLAVILSKHNGCFCVKSKGAKTMVLLTGKPENIAITRALYAYCVAEVDRLTKDHAYSKGKVFSNNFRLGCVDAIENSINEEIQRQKEFYANNERALVVINQTPIDLQESKETFHKKVGKTFAGSKSRYHVDYSGRQAGRQAGSDIYGGFGSNRIGY